LLHPLWPGADRVRLKGINDYGDFLGTPWLIEAKKRKRIFGEIWGWILTAITKTRWNEIHHGLEKDTLPWAVVFAQDKRQLPGIDLVVVPAWHYCDLVERTMPHDMTKPRPY